MKTIIFTSCIIASYLMLNCNLHAQSTTANNNIGVGKFIGYNDAQNLEFRTNNTTRMQLMQSGNSVVNGFTIDRSGFLGLSTQPNFFTTGAATPFALLHLNGDNPMGFPESLGYRPWMRHGIVYTHNQDIMYVGPRRIGADDKTDAVIAWGDNSTASQFGPDNLTFIYTTGNGSEQSGAGSMGGLEVARMTTDGHTGIGTSWTNTFQPKRTLDVIRQENVPQFRITRNRATTAANGRYADFLVSDPGHLHIMPASGSAMRNTAFGFTYDPGNPNTLPTQRVDVDGTIRLRQVPSATPDVLMTGTEELANGDYSLNYLAFTGLNTDVLGGDGSWVDISNFGCEWNMVNNGGSNDLVMGYPGACNEGNVGIGLDNPMNARLQVESINTGINMGVQISVANNLPQTTGILSDAFAGQVSKAGAFRGQGESEGYGVIATGSGPFRSIGVEGWALEGELSIGVAGHSTFGVNSIGIYGEGNTSAGYFVNGTVTSGPALYVSDEKFKTNIESIDCGLECLQQLNPVSYDFKTEEFPHMRLGNQRQYGLIAQEVSEVLPDIVHMATKPEITDPESGEVVSAGEEHLAIEYGALIPILISSVQEQQAMIEAQQEQINLLSSMITDCCSGDAKSLNHPPVGENNAAYQLDVKLPSLQQNAPNPFSESTMIRYSLPEPAAMRLRVHNQNGQLIEVLTEGNMPAGDYNIRWDGSHLTPGVYLYILEVDGVELVKRAVKMN